MSIRGFTTRVARGLPVTLVQVGLAATLGCSDNGSEQQGVRLQAGDYHHAQWRLDTANLRLNLSERTFSLVVYGCDYVENESGVLQEEDGHTRLAPGADADILRWPSNTGNVAEVPHLTVSQDEDALEIALPSGEVQTWQAGGMCPGWCDQPEAFSDEPPPPLEPCDPPYR